MTSEEMTEAERAERLWKLWAPTPPELISLRPQYSGPKSTPKENRKRQSCEECHTWHEFPAIHLSYLGHADTTRLIAAADPFWTWEPVAGFNPETGEPTWVADRNGYPLRLSIWLTILGVTRYGIGTVGPGKTDPEKELLGDALRNAAMRFGIGADLWSKAHGGSDFEHSEHAYVPAAPRQSAAPPPPPPPARSEAALMAIEAWSSEQAFDAAHVHYTKAMEALSEAQRMAVKEWKQAEGIGWPLLPEHYERLMVRIQEAAAPEPEPEPAPIPCSCGSDPKLYPARFHHDTKTTTCAACEPF